jgi:transcriptional repressor NrdR
MKCPKCFKLDSDRVLESRESPGGETIRRRRECFSCKSRYTTYERIERPTLLVIKKDGSQEVFDRRKLLEGIVRSVGKFFAEGSTLENLVSQVEEKAISISEDNAISSKMIGSLVLSELADLNEVAYIRFASVYNNFKTVQEFADELRKIKAIKTKKSKEI